MTILAVASYTPADKTPRAFALSSTATSLQIVNGAGMRLQILLGASLVGLVNAGASVIFSVSNPSAVVVAPDQAYPYRPDATVPGTVAITTYAAGDTLPTRNTYEQGTLAPISGQIHFSMERLRSGLTWNVRDFGAQGDGVTDDRARIQAALDVARVLGGGRVYCPAGTYALGSTTANAEVVTVLAALQIGTGVSLVGDGPALTTLKATGGWQRNALLDPTYVPTREFWVATAAKGGSDANPGSKASPFLTIAFAVTQCTVAGGGYLIHVGPGTYAEAMVDTYAGSTAAGTQTAPNIILSDIPLGAVINSTATGATGRAFYLKTGWRVVGFEITGGNLAQSGAVALDGSYSAAIGNYIHDFSRGIGVAQGGSGVFVSSSAYTSPGIIIANNYIIRVGPVGSTQGHGIYANGNGTIVANNLIVSCDGDGIECFHTPSNLVIVGNTVFNCAAGAADGGILVGSGDAGWTVSGFYVANNILVNNTGYGIREFVSGGGIMGANTYTNNLMFGNTVAAFIALGGNVNANAQLADPLFMNQQTDGTGDFRLRVGSPAIDNGTDSSMPAIYGSLDLLGYARPVGTHRDIGAYEWGAWSPPPSSLVANYNPTTGNKDIVVSDMTLDGGSAASTGLMAGVALCRAQRSSVRSVTIKNTPGRFDQGVNDAPGLLLDYCSDSDVSGITLASDDGGAMGSGVMARYGFNLNIRGVSVQGLAYGNGVFLDTCSNVRVVATGIGGCGGAGVSLRNCSDFQLADIGSGLVAPSVAAYPYTAGQNVGNTGHGVYLLGSSGKILGLISQRNGGSGLWVDGAGVVEIVSYRGESNIGDGLTVGGSVGGGNVRINGLRSRLNTGYGAQFLTAALAVLSRMQDHVISSNGTAQLRIASTNYGVTGSITPPAVPATTVALTNPYPFDMTVFITGGTMTLVSLDGSGVGVATSPIYLRVRAGGTVTITYTVAPSWSWYVEN